LIAGFNRPHAGAQYLFRIVSTGSGRDEAAAITRGYQQSPRCGSKKATACN